MEFTTATASAEALESPEAADLRALTERLAELSIRKHSLAHRDIDWDTPENQIENGDLRWQATGTWDPLTHSDWYRDQPAETRAEIGLHRHVYLFKTVITFESALCQGLYKFAARLPYGHPAFRYAYHEIAEETQHTMMFQELIDRSAIDPPGDPTALDPVVKLMENDNPVHTILFFLAILAGEEAFDHLQRQTLKTPTTHPLIARISRIHVTEEARHVSFARNLLHTLTPQLTNRQHRQLRYQTPIILGRMAGHMFGSMSTSLAAWGIPADTMSELTESQTAVDLQKQSMSRLVALCGDLDLIDPRLTAPWSTTAGDRLEPPGCWNSVHPCDIE